MEQRINFKKSNKNVVITIPVSLIKWAAEHNSENPITVTDEQEFATKVMFELENNLGNPESGLTGFQELLDTAMLEVATNGEDCCEFLNP